MVSKFGNTFAESTKHQAEDITQFPVFEKGKTLEGFLALEKLIDDYEKISTEKLGNDLKVATLIRCCLPVLRQHLELNAGSSTTYKAVREALTTHEQTTPSWTTRRQVKT